MRIFLQLAMDTVSHIYLPKCSVLPLNETPDLWYT